MDPRLVLNVAAGVAGLLVGSFVNVCIFRLPRECMSIVRPRSRCPSCLKPIAWYDNIPILSWLILGRKCRHCRAPISIRYPLVELLTGALFAGAAYIQLFVAGGSPESRAAAFAVQAYVSAALIICAFIDLEFTILPDEVTLSGVVLGLLAGAAFPVLHARSALWNQTLAQWIEWIGPGPLADHLTGLTLAGMGAFIGGGVIYSIGVLGKLAFRKEAMGFGDVKLMAFAGAFLGPDGVLLGIFLAVLAGALFGIAKYVVVRRMGYVPFGPFLSAGTLAMLFAEGPIRGAVSRYIDWVRGA